MGIACVGETIRFSLSELAVTSKSSLRSDQRGLPGYHVIRHPVPLNHLHWGSIEIQLTE